MPDDTKTFTFEEDGGNLKFNVTVESNGKVTITVTEGKADFNAIYWDVEDGEGGAGLDGPLNMNGKGSRDEDGNAIDWDGATALSMPGLGNDGPRQLDDHELPEGHPSVFDEDGEKTTFLDADDADNNSFEFSLEVGENGEFDLEGLTNIGIRATSVNGDGSIKAVSSPDDPDDPHCPDIISEWGNDPIDHLVFYFSDNETGEIDFAVKMDMRDYDQSDKWELTDEYFEDCLADIEAYLAHKEENDPNFIYDYDFKGSLVGLKVVGTDDTGGDDGPKEMFFEIDTSGTVDFETLPDDENIVDMEDDHGQSFFNYAWFIEGGHYQWEQQQADPDGASELEEGAFA